MHDEPRHAAPKVNPNSPLVVCTTLGHGPSWKWFAPVFDIISVSVWHGEVS